MTDLASDAHHATQDLREEQSKLKQEPWVGRMEHLVLPALQEAAEAMLVSVFEDANLCAVSTEYSASVSAESVA